jgi:DNA-binding LacI/PurR family transcriptional regulator
MVAAKLHSHRVSTMNRLPQRTSLVSQTAGVILEEIEAGHWARWLPGEHELCAHLHVSRRTIRAALEQLGQNGVVRCAQGKRREIVSAQKRSRKPLTKRVIVLLPVPVLSLSPFGVFLIDHLREHLAEAGYLVETHSSRVPYRARMPQELENLAQSLRPAGWVLLHSTEQMQRWFSERQLPCVVAGSRYPGVRLPSVDTDFEAVCQHAVGRFLAKGRQSLALLNPQPEAAGDVKTREGFLAAAGKAASLVIRAEVLQHDGSVAGICTRLNGLVSREQPPNAMLVSRPRHVLTVIGHLLRRGLRIPEDMAIISRDDDLFLEDVVPGVARYSRNPKLFASKVSRVVLEMVSGTTNVVDLQIMPRFISGETLG